MILAIQLFQIAVFVTIIGSLIWDRLCPLDSWKYLKISNWVFYFSGIVSFVLTFGIIAILEEKDIEQYGVCMLFLACCVICVVLMLIQKVWQIKYNGEDLIFRNAFGQIKRYKVADITIINGQRITRILLDDKTVIKWDTIIMNLEQDVALSKFLSSR